MVAGATVKLTHPCGVCGHRLDHHTPVTGRPCGHPVCSCSRYVPAQGAGNR